MLAIPDAIPWPVCAVCQHQGHEPTAASRIAYSVAIIGRRELWDWRLVCDMHYQGGPFYPLDKMREPKRRGPRPTELDPTAVAAALKNRSLREAAEILGVPKSTLADWMHRKRSP